MRIQHVKIAFQKHNLVPTADAIGYTNGDSYRRRLLSLQSEKCQIDYGKLRWWPQHSNAYPLEYTCTVCSCRVWACVHTTMTSNKTQHSESHRTYKLICKRNKTTILPNPGSNHNPTVNWWHYNQRICSSDHQKHNRTQSNQIPLKSIKRKNMHVPKELQH